MLPFLPIFLDRELGVAGPRALALWTGIANALLGLGLGLAAPLWGVVADRSGRKPMLVRAMLGGAITLVLMAFSGTPLIYAAGWGLFGALSATAPAAAALVASETPRSKMAFALGTIVSAQSVGQSIGPALGGIAASAVGLRAAYLIGAAIEVLAVVPVLLLATETRADRKRMTDAGSGAADADHGRSIVRIAPLLVALALFVTSFVGMQRLVVLRVLALAPATATFWTGIAFTLAGVATALCAILASRLGRLIGHGRSAMASSAVMTAVLIGAATTDSALVLVALIAASGAANGIARPAIQTMLTVASPSGRAGTVFGFVQMASAAALLLGPLIGGVVAAMTDLPTALVVLAGSSLVAIPLIGRAGASDERVSDAGR